MFKRSSNDCLKVLVFYQGAIGRGYVDYIVSYVIRKLDVGLKIELEAVGDNDSSLRDPIYDKLRRKIEENDAAIAVLTLDERCASEAGNLWFEIGHWLGSKRYLSAGDDNEYLSSIKVLQQRRPEGTDKWPVEVITNLGTGRVAPPFGTDADLAKEVSDFLHQQAQRKLTRCSVRNDKVHPVAPDKRVFDTLGCSSNYWWSDHIDFCEGNSGGSCRFRSESLAFVAELLRMGRSNREHAEIETALFVIGGLCRGIVLIDELTPTETVTRKQERQDKMRHLYGELTKLARISEELLDRRRKDNMPVWKRIENFLDHRLRIAADCYDRGIRGFPCDSEQMRLQVEEFCIWAKQYSSHSPDDYEPYSATSYFRYGKQQNEQGANRPDSYADEIHDAGRRATDMAMILRDLGKEYFAACRNLLKGKFLQYDEHRDLPTLLNDIMLNLPLLRKICG